MAKNLAVSKKPTSLSNKPTRNGLSRRVDQPVTWPITDWEQAIAAEKVSAASPKRNVMTKTVLKEEKYLLWGGECVFLFKKNTLVCSLEVFRGWACWLICVSLLFHNELASFLPLENIKTVFFPTQGIARALQCGGLFWNLKYCKSFRRHLSPETSSVIKKNDSQISRKDIVHLVIDSTVSLGFDSSRTKEKTHMTM